MSCSDQAEIERMRKMLGIGDDNAEAYKAAVAKFMVDVADLPNFVANLAAEREGNK